MNSFSIAVISFTAGFVCALAYAAYTLDKNYTWQSKQNKELTKNDGWED